MPAEDKSRDKALEIDGVHYIYPPPRRIHAVNGINLRFEQGEFVAIIGQNGSGKTTLARCTSGFLNPTSGQVLVGGRRFHSLPAPVQARRVGYVFQNPDHQLFKDTVWDDVAFGPKNLRLPADEVAATVESVLRRLRLWDRRGDHPHRLAKGDRQRLAVAAVVALQPDVLIVDEPTTGQDPVKSREVMDLLRDLNQRDSTTVIAITHCMDLVAEYAARVIVMCQGEVILDGPPRAVFAQPDQLRRTFVEPPPICQLGLRLGLEPLPLSVAEAKTALMSRWAQ